MNTFSLKDLQLGNPAELTQGIIRSIAQYIGSKLFFNPIGRKRRLLSYMGMLNNLIYCYASDRGVVRRLEDKKGNERYEIDESRIQEFITPGSVSVALSGTREYMQKWWGFKVFRSPDNIREMRSQLSELGLFTFVVPKFKIQRKGQPSVAESASYDDFDITKALLVYQAIESILVDGNEMVKGFGWDSLPEHKGAMMKRLYDLVFKTGLGMRRSPSPDAGTGSPLDEQDSASERQAMKTNSKNRDRHELASLEATVYEYSRLGADHVLHDLHFKWLEFCDRIEHLKNKLFSHFEPVPMDADLPF